MERDPLMLNQRLMLMLTMDTTDMPDLMLMDTEPMVMDTPDTDTMARDLLMPSPRPRLTQLSSTPPAICQPSDQLCCWFCCSPGLQHPPRHQRQQCSSCQGCRQHCLQCRCPHPSCQDCCLTTPYVHHPVVYNTAV